MIVKYFIKFFEPLSEKIIILKSIDYIFYKRCLNNLNSMQPYSKKFYTEKLLKWLNNKNQK